MNLRSLRFWLLSLLLLAGLPLRGFAALSANTVWECRASGAGVSDNDGGGWAPLTVSTFSGTDLVVDASVNTKVTSVTHNFVAADVGTRLYLTSGTGWTTGFYTINSVAANAATLSSSPAATSTTGGTWAEVGIEYSKQNSPQVAIDNSTITTSITANVITFTGYTASAKDIGNNVHMLTGTNVTAGWYQITAFTASTWTVTGAVALPTSGTTTNATGNMGGALLTLSNATGLAGAMVASNKAFCTGAFTATTATAISFAQSNSSSAANPATRLIGYGAVRGDSTHATLTLQTNTGQTGIAGTGATQSIEQIDVDCASLGTSKGISMTGASCQVINCKVANFVTNGILMSNSQGKVRECEVTGGTGGQAIVFSAATGGQVLRCWVHDNASVGIVLAQHCAATFNLVTNNSGAGSDGIQAAANCQIENNTIHACGRHGIAQNATALAAQSWRNNILTNNGGFGLLGSAAGAIGAESEFDGNAFFNNTSGTRSLMDSAAGIFGVNPYVNTHDVILTVSPYVGPTSGSTANFGLNDVPGGGRSCRRAGFPGSWPGNTGTTGYLDMGAVQTKSNVRRPFFGF